MKAALAAFESGGNVDALHRAEPYGENGTPWAPGRRELGKPDAFVRDLRTRPAAARSTCTCSAAARASTAR